MAKCKLLAFLLCDSATQDSDGKVTLHGLFDRVILPHGSAPPKDFFVFYRVDVKEPCTVTLRVVDPVGNEIAGNWRDSLSQIGPMQTVRALDTSRFMQPGRYVLELSQESDDLTALSLARMQLIVEKEGG
ncbi:MAG: hypothetical protein WCD04_06940 [Terriglobia bacterium]|jgi:hypothetical protein